MLLTDVWHTWYISNFSQSERCNQNGKKEWRSDWKFVSHENVILLFRVPITFENRFQNGKILSVSRTKIKRFIYNETVWRFSNASFVLVQFKSRVNTRTKKLYKYFSIEFAYGPSQRSVRLCGSLHVRFISKRLYFSWFLTSYKFRHIVLQNGLIEELVDISSESHEKCHQFFRLSGMIDDTLIVTPNGHSNKPLICQLEN